MNSPAIHVTIMMLLATGSYSQPMPTPSCPTSWGNLTIPFPYPFGIGSGCIADDSFLITCNSSYNPLNRSFINLNSKDVLDISLDGQMRVASSVASDCYDSSDSQTKKSASELSLSKFPISSKQNKLTAFGCDTSALVQVFNEREHMGNGSISLFNGTDRLLNGICSGIGCCLSSIPEDVKDNMAELLSILNHTVLRGLSGSFSVLAETEAFEFKDLQKRKAVPGVLDWSAGYLSCQEAQQTLSSSACLAAHSECIDSSSGVGYHCKCMAGFHGNPYHADGCQDINECIALEPCVGMCTNLLGSYSCSCPEGLEGDGMKDDEGCHSKRMFNGSIFFYLVLVLVVPSIGTFWIYWRNKQKKVDRLRRSLFLRNGGQLLDGRIEIFGAEELKKATNNYSEDNVISGEVHNGYKYRGILPNGLLVTVVKHDAVEECDIELLITYLITLSNLRHMNVLRLNGCCLETQTPLLVFERFELETSLHDHILDDYRACDLSWDIRLRIASETARVLEYMHCRFEAHTIHSCISSSSILLLENGGMVKLQYIDVVSFPQAPFSEWIVSKLGYLDLHYLQTHQFTEKSDVYSFGVVLAEILTGEAVISPHRSQGERLLADYFVAKIDDDDHDLATILDHRIESDDKIDELTEVAALARRCLSVSPSDRPTITEVVITLDLVLSHVSGSETN